MRRVSITEAKNRFNALLEQVREGETIVIEDRGVPVAHIVPLPGAGAEPDDDRLARLLRKGLVTPAVEDTDATWGELDDLPPARSGASVLEALLEERRTGR